jgi:hypothetical protein
MATARLVSLCVLALLVLAGMGAPALADDKEIAQLLVSAKRWEQPFQLFGKPFMFNANGTYTRGDGKNAGTWTVRDGKLTLTGSFLNTTTFKDDPVRTFGIEWLDAKMDGFWLSEPGKNRDAGYFGGQAFMKHDR